MMQYMEKSMGFFHLLDIIITIDGKFSMIYRQYKENFRNFSITLGIFEDSAGWVFNPEAISLYRTA